MRPFVPMHTVVFVVVVDVVIVVWIVMGKRKRQKTGWLETCVLLPVTCCCFARCIVVDWSISQGDHESHGCHIHNVRMAACLLGSRLPLTTPATATPAVVSETLSMPFSFSFSPLTFAYG